MQNKQVRISAAIITFNEEKNIARCIQALQGIADEIVVVDSFSTDRTKEICLELGVTFTEHAFEGYVQQMNYTLTQVNYDYVLSVDADEVLSDKLRNSVLKVKQNWAHDAYTFNRLTNYCGRWIRHCGWYPDKKLRLYDRRKGQWEGINPHYSFKIEANSHIQHIPGDLLHYSYDSLSQHIEQINKFSSIAAREYFSRKKKTYFLIHLVLYPTITFFTRYLLKLGFLDGLMGYIICKNTAYYKFLKYAKLIRLYKKNT